MHFAVIRLSSFGDIVLTEPVTRAIKARFPGARLYFIARTDYAQVPRLFEAVDEVVPYAKHGANPGIGNLAGSVEFEAVLDLQNNPRSRRVSAMLRSRRLSRYRRPVVRRFLSVKMPWLWRGELRHTIDLYGDALGRLGFGLEDRRPRISPPEDARAEARKRLGGGAGGPAPVALCPGGSSEYKRWPETSFAELALSLSASGRRVMLLGSEADRSVVEAVAAGSGTPEGLVMVSDEAADLAALLSLAPVTVTNDSGLMHLAAAVGSRVVAMFGPTSPSLGFAPLGPGHKVLTLGLACSPCSYHGNRPCRLARRICLEDLTPAEVEHAVHAIYSEAARA